MNELLIAVDFSESSLNALEHGFGIAERFKMHMVLVWVETKSSTKFLNIKSSESIEDAVTKKFIELKSHYQPRLHGMDFEFRIQKGIAYNEIVSLAEKLEVDLILTGSHGIHGYKQMFVGNNANNIIQKSKIPVIAIQPNRKETTSLSKIVAPIDSTIDTRQKIPLITSFAQKFGAEVHLVGLTTSSISTLTRRVEDYVNQSQKFLESNRVKVVKTMLKTDDIAKSTLDYATKIEANLIAVMVEQESFSSDLWLGTQCAQLVNQSPIPVLCVPNKEIIKSAPGL